jgi:8-oxo-dGTP pyrophosphatase MutT (NUDIX family)
MTEAADLNRTLVLLAGWNAGSLKGGTKNGGKMLLQLGTHQANRGIGFFGGKLQEGEEAINGIVREVRQELGIDLAISPKDPYEFPEIEADGWRIHAFQTIRYFEDELDPAKVEGESVYMTPQEAWQDSRLLPATRAVLKEIIMVPNGLIDN